MPERKILAEEFARSRNHLRAVAFRLLGSADAADDAVQDAWLRASSTDLTLIDNVPGWLTAIVSRICLDALKARRRSRIALTPLELLRTAKPTPEDEIVHVERIGLAMVVVLERLSPLERVAFVLHDMFSVPFEDIAKIVARTPIATKKLASRARLRVRGSSRSSADVAQHRKLIEAFLAAARAGDVDGLVAVLAPDVVRRVDKASREEGVLPVLRGASLVAKETAGNAARARWAQPILVNGSVGAIVAPRGLLQFVLTFSIDEHRITTIDVIGDHVELATLDLALPDLE